MAHSNRGSLLHDVFRRFAEALEEFDRALALDPNLAQAQFNRGNALVSLGQHREALASYDRALALGFAEAHMYRGQLLRLLGRPEEALASFDRWLAIDPRRADAYAVAVHLSRGALLHNALHRDPEALEAFDRALALDPNCTMAHGNRSMVLRALGREPEAQARPWIRICSIGGAPRSACGRSGKESQFTRR